MKGVHNGCGNSIVVCTKRWDDFNHQKDVRVRVFQIVGVNVEVACSNGEIHWVVKVMEFKNMTHITSNSL